MSISHPNISAPNAALASKYEVSFDLMNDPEIVAALKAIDAPLMSETVPNFPGKSDAYQADVEHILEQQLSTENIHTLERQERAPNLIDIQDDVETRSILEERANDFVDEYKLENSILRDAKRLFRKHVVSELKETKNDLWHGSALTKLGTVLSCPGRVLTGISVFWDELIKDRPILKILDAVILKPMIVGVYIQFWPALVTIKASELVGRSMCAYAKAPKGSKWSAIKAAALEMLTSTVNHAVRVAGVAIESEILDSVRRSGLLSQTQKNIVLPVLESIVKSENRANILESFRKNPESSILIIAGAVASSQAFGVDPKESIKIASNMMTSKNKALTIKTLLEDQAMQQAAPLLAKVYATSSGLLPKTSQSFEKVVNHIIASTKINEVEKSVLVQTITEYSLSKSKDMLSERVKVSDLFSPEQKAAINKIISADKKVGALENLMQDPTTSIAILAGAAACGKNYNESIKIAEDVVSGKTKVNIDELLTEHGAPKIKSLVTEVFSDKKLPETFKAIVDAVKDSKAINDKDKGEFVKAITAHAVASILQAKQKDEPSQPSKSWATRLGEKLAKAPTRQTAV